jgi:rRNA biogenesis protein RRP5
MPSIHPSTRRALPVVEPKPLYLALLGILERSQRWALAADVWRTATKKFSASCKVWLGAYESALQVANRSAAAAADDDGGNGGGGGGGSNAAAAAAAAAAPRLLLERSLKSLPKRKHIKALTR